LQTVATVVFAGIKEMLIVNSFLIILAHLVLSLSFIILLKDVWLLQKKAWCKLKKPKSVQKYSNQ